MVLVNIVNNFATKIRILVPFNTEINLIKQCAGGGNVQTMNQIS